MQIVLKWNNRNVGEDGTRIYRATSSMNCSSLPAALATVGAGVSTYTDTAVTPGVTYYYYLEAYRGTDKILSTQITALAAAYSGPGPQTLIAGDLECGLFGDTTIYELMRQTDLGGYLSTGGALTYNATYVDSASDSLAWFKLAYKGKILFVPKRAVFCGVKWTELYAKGAVYGSDDNGNNLPSGVTPVIQNARITLRGNVFKIRLLQGVPTNFTTTITTVATNAQTPETDYEIAQDVSACEFNDLFCRLYDEFPSTTKGKSLVGGNAASNSLLNTYLSLGQMVSRTILCQEWIARGGNQSNARSVMGWGGKLAAPPVATTASAPFGTLQLAWLPVLEWIPS